MILNERVANLIATTAAGSLVDPEALAVNVAERAAALLAIDPELVGAVLATGTRTLVTNWLASRPAPAALNPEISSKEPV